MPILSLIVYDISDDDIRTEMREIIKDFGGEKLQFCVYQVCLPKQKLIELQDALRDLLQKTNGVVHFLYPCKNCYNKIIHITNRL